MKNCSEEDKEPHHRVQYRRFSSSIFSLRLPLLSLVVKSKSISLEKKNRNYHVKYLQIRTINIFWLK